MRVLVIDDNPADQHLLREAAEQVDDPLDLTFAMDGEHGLTLLRHGSHGPGNLPHLILLDMHMPGLSGLEVLARLKSDANLARIPVVILTTSSLPTDAARAFELRASAFMTKNPNFMEFQRHFHTLMTSWRRRLHAAEG